MGKTHHPSSILSRWTISLIILVSGAAIVSGAVYVGKFPDGVTDQNQSNGWTADPNTQKEIRVLENGTLTCKKITMTQGPMIFIPTRTEAEWISFRDNKPINITISSCSAGPCNGGTKINKCQSGTPPDCNSAGLEPYCECPSGGGGWLADGPVNCAPVVHGVCGLAEASYVGAPGDPAPSTNLCSAGTSTSPYVDGSFWKWECLGTGGGDKSRVCAADITPGLYDGVCGPATGGPVDTYPTTGLCTKGTSTATDSSGTDGTFNWTCNPTDKKGNSASCSATKSAPPPSGSCGDGMIEAGLCDSTLLASNPYSCAALELEYQKKGYGTCVHEVEGNSMLCCPARDCNIGILLPTSWEVGFNKCVAGCPVAPGGGSIMPLSHGEVHDLLADHGGIGYMRFQCLDGRSNIIDQKCSTSSNCDDLDPQ